MIPAEIKIEQMTSADLPAVVEIESLSFTSPWSRRMFEADIKKASYWVAKEVDRVIGYIGLQTVLDEGHIPTLAVHPKFRGQGIGYRLVGMVVEAGKEKKLARIFLEVRESNLAARKLYAGFNFKEISRRKEYYHNPEEDALMLALTLQ